MRAEKRNGEEIPSMIDAAVVQDRAVISHRLLTEEEADAIWTALNSAPLLTQNQELRINVNASSKHALSSGVTTYSRSVSSARFTPSASRRTKSPRCT